jgi:UDP-glucose 4-epimerase
MRTIVTGGAGFIGSHLAERLLGLGHDVRVVDDLSSGKREQVPDGAELVVADIRDDEAARAVEDFKPELVCHLAAQMDVRRSVRDPRFDVEVNLGGLVHVIESARRAGALERVLFAGSGGAMYGEQEVYPAAEDHRVQPTSFYGLAKATGEQYLEVFERLYGLSWCSLRFANVFGPRQDAHGEAGVVAIFVEKMLAGEDVTVFGDGEQTRDFVFVDDVVEAHVQAIQKMLRGGYNVGTGIETSVNALAHRLLAVTGADVNVTYAEARAGEQLRSSIDPGKLERDTAFRPATSLDDGLAKTVAWFRATSA